MKKVRFETPNKGLLPRMDDSECHSPRPFIDKQVPSLVSHVPDLFQCQRILPYSDDPVQRYESSDSSPYPSVQKTSLPNAAERGSKYIPSNDLDLSMLDSHEPRRQQLYRTPTQLHAYSPPAHNISTPSYAPTPRLGPAFNDNIITNEKAVTQPTIPSPKKITPPHVLRKDNGFFLRRDNLNKFTIDTQPLATHFNRLALGKENEPVSKKIDKQPVLLEALKPNFQENVNLHQQYLNTTGESDCRCHHCLRAIQISTPQTPPLINRISNYCQTTGQVQSGFHQCPCMPVLPSCFHYDRHMQSSQKCHSIQSDSPVPQNAVDKKNWAIQKLEQNKKECKDLDKHTNLVKEKREPTVADLFKIIKLQNEQLQLLQEKVDNFISNNNHRTQNVLPVQNYVTEHVALQTIDAEHKISIGVMTSFEMVRTSTVINKEILKQSCENAQMQCNRSQISIKEVISKPQPVHLNFLDGITPVTRDNQTDTSSDPRDESRTIEHYASHEEENVMEDKTLNELSLYNVQVDATTPLISPEQSLYLDVRDYSE